MQISAMNAEKKFNPSTYTYIEQTPLGDSRTGKIRPQKKTKTYCIPPENRAQLKEQKPQKKYQQTKGKTLSDYFRFVVALIREENTENTKKKRHHNGCA